MRRTSRVATILLVTLVGSIWLWYVSPRPVVVVTTVIPESVPTWYMLTAFPVLGMLVADLLALLRRRDRWLSALELGLQIGLIVALSGGRLTLRIPLSGHTLLFAYFIARRSLTRRWSTDADLLELAVASVFLVVCAYPKLLWWGDPITLSTGVGLGVVMALAGAWLLPRAVHRRPPGG